MDESAAFVVGVDWEAAVFRIWTHLVQSRPILQKVLKEFVGGEKTLYDIQKSLGSKSVNRVLKEMVDMRVLEVVREEKIANGLTKKWYALTLVGWQLAEAGAEK